MLDKREDSNTEDDDDDDDVLVQTTRKSSRNRQKKVNTKSSKVRTSKKLVLKAFSMMRILPFSGIWSSKYGMIFIEEIMDLLLIIHVLLYSHYVSFTCVT